MGTEAMPHEASLVQPLQHVTNPIVLLLRCYLLCSVQQIKGSLCVLLRMQKAFHRDAGCLQTFLQH